VLLALAPVGGVAVLVGRRLRRRPAAEKSPKVAVS
jgi:hypothetical protein